MNAKKVAVIMGSDSDWPILKPAVELLKQFGIASEVTVASAHRTPAKVRTFVESAPEKGVAAFIVGAGAAAHLAGVALRVGEIHQQAIVNRLGAGVGADGSTEDFKQAGGGGCLFHLLLLLC